MARGPRRPGKWLPVIRSPSSSTSRPRRRGLRQVAATLATWLAHEVSRGRSRVRQQVGCSFQTSEAGMFHPLRY